MRKIIVLATLIASGCGVFDEEPKEPFRIRVDALALGEVENDGFDTQITWEGNADTTEFRLHFRDAFGEPIEAFGFGETFQEYQHDGNGEWTEQIFGYPETKGIRVQILRAITDGNSEICDPNFEHEQCEWLFE